MTSLPVRAEVTSFVYLSHSRPEMADYITTYVNDQGKTEPLEIMVKDPTKTLIANPRRIPFAHRFWLENHLKELAENGIIDEVTDQNTRIWSSPCMVVTKQNSDKLRLVVDFRAVN